MLLITRTFFIREVREVHNIRRMVTAISYLTTSKVKSGTSSYPEIVLCQVNITIVAALLYVLAIT